MAAFRIEKDTMGELEVPADRYYRQENFKNSIKKILFDNFHTIIQTCLLLWMSNCAFNS